MELYSVDGPWPGRLSLCARPRSGPWLEGDVRALRSAGVGVLVSALTAEEVAKLGLEPVGEACAAEGVTHVSFPVGNLLTPPLEVALPALRLWDAELAGGRAVAMHCWATVGRSPTLAAGLLVVGGVSPRCSPSNGGFEGAPDCPTGGEGSSQPPGLSGTVLLCPTGHAENGVTRPGQTGNHKQAGAGEPEQVGNKTSRPF